MHGLRASGVCLLVAVIAARSVAKDGRRHSTLPTSENENDLCFMFQSRRIVELALAKREAIKQTSADHAKAGTAISKPKVPTESSALASNAERTVMTRDGSDDVGGPQSYFRLGLASFKMWRTKRIRSWRSDMMEQSSWWGTTLALLVPLALCIGCHVLGFIIIDKRLHHWVTKKETEAAFESASVDDVQSPCPERNSTPCSERTSSSRPQCAQMADMWSPSSSDQTPPQSEARFLLPMRPLQASASGQMDSEVVILSKVSDACLHVSISHLIGGTRVEVSTPQGKTGPRVTVGPAPNTTPANSGCLLIHGQTAAVFDKDHDLHGTSPPFIGTLEEKGLGAYTVLQDQQPMIYLDVGPNHKQLMVTTDHEKLASVRCVASNGEDHIDVRIDVNADAILVLACALAVVMHLFV